MKMSIDDKKPNDLSFKLFQNKPLDLTFLETYFIFYVKSNLAIIEMAKASRKIRTLLGHLSDGQRTILAYLETWIRLYFF